MCSNCGYESGKWLGKCPACNEWNSFYEEKLSKGTGGSITKEKKIVTPKKLNEVINVADKKNEKRGAFDSKIFLEKVIERVE